MLAHTLQGNHHGPAFEGVAIQPEAEVTAQCYKGCLLPVAIQAVSPVLHFLSSFLHAFSQQGIHPHVGLHGGDRRDDTVATRIIIRLTKFLIVQVQMGRDIQLQLGRVVALLSSNLAVDNLCNVQDGIIVGGIYVVPMLEPVG